MNDITRQILLQRRGLLVRAFEVARTQYEDLLAELDAVGDHLRDIAQHVAAIEEDLEIPAPVDEPGTMTVTVPVASHLH
jgi:hypothetical protein